MNQRTILRTVLTAVLSLVATTATAHDFEVDGIYYNNNGDGTVSVTYQGSSYNEYANRYTGDVVIPSSVTYSGTTYSVTSIGYYAFYNCSGLTGVTIPNSVSSIGEAAFSGCSGLTSVTIPNSVTSISDYAFEGCSGLTSITIPNSVKSIGVYAFYGCSGLTSVTIPNSVTSIGYRAFQDCSGLKSITIPNSVTSIGGSAFYGCNGLTSITIPDSVTSISTYVFYGCSGLTSVTIPNSVKSIGDYAFNGCSGLKSITIPNSVSSIGSYAFSGCSGLTSVTIPNSVTSIGGRAFDGCSGLTSIIVDSENQIYDSRDNCNAIIETATNTLHTGCKNTIIPNSVTSIGEWTFSGCSGLTSITIPNSVISIGDYAFYQCSGLTSVTIPNSVSSIGDYAFYDCSGLTSVTIPNSVSSIGNYAFLSCSGLTSVTIPNSVNSIGDYAFYQCSGLKTIFYNAENCADVKANSYVFTSGSNIIIGKDVKKVPNYLFYSLYYSPKRVISQSVTPPTCGANTFNSKANGAKLYVPSEAESDYFLADVWCDFDIATVDKPITAIALSESEATIALGSTKQLTATATPSDATIADIFEWSSSNPEVAVVDGNGLVTAVGEGTTVITAKAFDGSEVTGSCNITVRSFNATSITLNYTELNMFEKEYTTLTYAILPEDATVKTAEWSVSDSNVLTYREMSDGSLKIVAKSAGTATVTARTTDGSNLSATCVVTVNPVATNVNQIKPGTNKVKFALQGMKMHDGVLYACTTTESVNKSTPTLHGNDANNMAPYEDRNFANFDQRDWVAISGLEEGFVGKELSYPFEATFADGVLTPSGTISATAEATAYNLNTFRAENILHGGYSNYAEGDYKAYYVPARVNEVAKFMGLIETIGGVKYLYSNNAYGRKDGQGIKVENCTIADNSKVYSILEGILVADKSTKAGVKIIMLKDLGQATGVEGVDAAAARIYSANGNIIIAAAEDGEAAVYDFTGRLIKSVPVVAGDNTAVPVMPGCYIVRTGVKTQSVVVK